jgi:hypothetical protein
MSKVNILEGVAVFIGGFRKFCANAAELAQHVLIQRRGTMQCLDSAPALRVMPTSSWVPRASRLSEPEACLLEVVLTAHSHSRHGLSIRNRASIQPSMLALQTNHSLSERNDASVVRQAPRPAATSGSMVRMRT